jgi:hypothetical protein
MALSLAGLRRQVVARLGKDVMERDARRQAGESRSSNASKR